MSAWAKSVKISSHVNFFLYSIQLQGVRFQVDSDVFEIPRSLCMHRYIILVHAYTLCRRFKHKLDNSRVIFGPPVTTESRGRFESGFGYFEVFKKNWAPMPLAKVWAKPRRGPKFKMAAGGHLGFTKICYLKKILLK